MSYMNTLLVWNTQFAHYNQEKMPSNMYLGTRHKKEALPLRPTLFKDILARLESTHVPSSQVTSKLI